MTQCLITFWLFYSMNEGLAPSANCWNALMNTEFVLFRCLINLNRNHRQGRIVEPDVSALPCERGKAAVKDSYEIQLTQRQISFSLLP